MGTAAYIDRIGIWEGHLSDTIIKVWAFWGFWALRVSTWCNVVGFIARRPRFVLKNNFRLAHVFAASEDR